METTVNNTKIRNLEARARDQSLSRAERSEAMEALTWERFRRDKRPALSYKKYIRSELLLNASTALTFSIMLIGDMIGREKSNSPLFGTFFMAVMVFTLASLGYYFFLKGKFKTEPPDELSKLNMAKSGNMATASLVFILMLVIAGVFMFGGVDTITVNGSNCLYMLVSLEFFHMTLTKGIYLFYERENESEAEDE